MPQLITATAQMQCDKGAAPALLTVTSQTFVQAAGKLIATQTDVQPLINIPPFGVCSVTQKPCMPAPVAWQQTREKDAINGLKKLTEDSTCPCTIGGTIRFLTTGHGLIVSAEKG